MSSADVRCCGLLHCGFRCFWTFVTSGLFGRNVSVHTGTEINSRREEKSIFKALTPESALVTMKRWSCGSRFSGHVTDKQKMMWPQRPPDWDTRTGVGRVNVLDFIYRLGFPPVWTVFTVFNVYKYWKLSLWLVLCIQILLCTFPLSPLRPPLAPSCYFKVLLPEF